MDRTGGRARAPARSSPGARSRIASSDGRRRSGRDDRCRERSPPGMYWLMMYRRPPSSIDIVHGDDPGVVAELRHGLGFALQAGPTRLVEHDRLDLGQRDVAIEAGVASQVDLLAGALTEQAGDAIAAAAHGFQRGRPRWAAGSDQRRCRIVGRAAEALVLAGPARRRRCRSARRAPAPGRIPRRCGPGGCRSRRRRRRHRRSPGRNVDTARWA